MPIYQYECKHCGRIQEHITKISNKPKSILCPACEEAAFPIISASGAVHTDGDVKWLNSARMTLQRDNEKPIETRSEWKKYLKTNNLTCCG
jgi:putative FmdB family regulatory protein